MSICFECGEIELYYVTSCGDPAVGDSVVLMFVEEGLEEVAAEIDLIEGKIETMESAQRIADPDTVIAAQDDLAKLLKDYIKPGDTKPSKHLVQAYDIRGKKWTYVRSDKMRNHVRSYNVDKSLLEARAQGQSGDAARQLPKGGLRSAWDKISKDIADDLKKGVGRSGTIISDSISGSIFENWEISWLSWVDAVNDSLMYSRSGANYDLSAAAQLFRYYAGYRVKLGYDPSTNTYGLSASGEARAVLAEAKADLAGYLPDRDGWHALMEFADGDPSGTGDGSQPQMQLNFGYFRFRARIGVDAMVGASVMGTAGIEYVPKVAGKVGGKGSSAGGKGEIAAGAFAGVEAGADVRGGLEWDNPETRQREGTHGWATVFEVGGLLSANAGIGGEFQFNITLDSTTGRLFVRAQAQLVIGVGAKGGMLAVVGLDTLFDFFKYVFHQLMNNDFSLLRFITREAYNAHVAMIVFVIEHGTALVNEVGALVSSAIDAIKSDFEDGDRAERFARRVKSNPEMLLFSPPEAKGMILYRLSQTFWSSREEHQEGAILVVMDTVQSAREWSQIAERITINGQKSNSAAGLSRLNGVLDFGSQTKFNVKLAEILRRRRPPSMIGQPATRYA